jgi:Holliday junction resolvasome RuvABC endonuclease subunit
MSIKNKTKPEPIRPFLTHHNQCQRMARSIFGIDPSLSSTGWCSLTETHGAVYGHFGSELRGPGRLRDLSDKLASMLDLDLPNMVVIEGYSYGSLGKRECLAEWGGAIRLLLWDRQIPTLVVPPSTLKKFVISDCEKGKLRDKDQMRLSSYLRWGVQFKNTDECDAHALAQLGRIRLSLDLLSLQGTYQDSSGEPQRVKEAALTAAPLIFPPAYLPTGPARVRKPV